MSTSHTISINIPDDLYKALQERAERNQTSIEATILELLELFFKSETRLNLLFPKE